MIFQICLIILFSSDVELFKTQKALVLALKDRNVPELVAGYKSCAAENTLDGLQVMLKYYGPTEDITDENAFTWEDHYRLFTVCASGIAKITDREAVVAIPRLALKWKHWAGRFVLVAGARANPKVDAIQMSLDVLKHERHPLVIAEAVKTLGGSKKKKVIPYLIDYWEKIRKKIHSSHPTRHPRNKRSVSSVMSYSSPEWERVPYLLQQALTRLCGRIMYDPDLYKSYYQGHKDQIDPTKPVQFSNEGRRTGLFGLDIVGKNIVFVLDISGSMKTTDPLPRGERRGPRTGVKNGPDFLFPNEDRMRIFRAKKELKKVVNSLPEDKSFNIIAFSSELKPWKDNLVPAIEKNKKNAVDFIESLHARGITLTDYALEMAFQDPIVDTIYLVTDGAPTHRGSMGPGLPSDAKELMKEIIHRLKVLNYRRSIQIFTLGFPGSEENFLKTISGENGGTYRPIK